MNFKFVRQGTLALSLLTLIGVAFAMRSIPVNAQSSGDVAAIKTATVTYVLNGYTGAQVVVNHYAIVNGYALTEYSWSTEGAGEALLQKVNGVWTVLGKGGGEMSVSIIVAFGVPQATANELHYEIQCPGIGSPRHPGQTSPRPGSTSCMQ